MKIFIFKVQRVRFAKTLLGLAGLAFLARIVIGVTNGHEFFAVTMDGLMEFTWVMLVTAAIFFLWDLRDVLARYCK